MSHLRAILQASPCKTLEKVPDSEVHVCKALQPLHLHTNPGTESCTRSGRKWTWPRRVSASRPSTSGGRTVSTILAYNRSPSLMTRPRASTSGITGTLSSWNLKILQINQVRARPVVSSGVKGTASCQHRLHRTAPGSLLVAVVWDSLD